jgi:hypothetical protein
MTAFPCCVKRCFLLICQHVTGKMFGIKRQSCLEIIFPVIQDFDPEDRKSGRCLYWKNRHFWRFVMWCGRPGRSEYVLKNQDNYLK